MIRDVRFYSEFYFNFNSSILGSLSSSLSSHSHHLTHDTFIATPLLPCGKFDGKIKKFTGNDKFGDADDHLTRAVHTFSHFTAIYTQQNIILCDLQGKICHFLSYQAFLICSMLFQVCLTMTRSCI